MVGPDNSINTNTGEIAENEEKQAREI